MGPRLGATAAAVLAQRRKAKPPPPPPPNNPVKPSIIPSPNPTEIYDDVANVERQHSKKSSSSSNSTSNSR